MSELNEYFEATSRASIFSCVLGDKGGFISFRNSGKRGSVKEFTLSLGSILSGLKDILNNINNFNGLMTYAEGEWRDHGSAYFTDLSLNSMITVQTKPCFTTFSKIINWANGVSASEFDDNKIDLRQESLVTTIRKLEELSETFTPDLRRLSKDRDYKKLRGKEGEILTSLSKPFLLLAGISGTGKTRFVREQAKLTGSVEETYCLTSVRPDWHEPSDLLGYVSRLGGRPQYVATDVLRFMVKAWGSIISSIDRDENGFPLDWKGRDLSEIPPYWLCLDEMNLAPVEQYFADYLSVLETRSWNDPSKLETSGLDYVYECDPLVKGAVFTALDIGIPEGEVKPTELLAKDLGLDLTQGRDKDIWDYFLAHGIAIPFNLIVAGTVNMDETTHGFSRKVIDRALSFDFGEFFPNDFKAFFVPVVANKALSYPTWTQVREEDLNGTCDGDGARSLAFLNSVNEVLKGTPFELAYRALNELLLAVVTTQPQDDASLMAVWDDFMMCKVLPRIEGDNDKLALITNAGAPDKTLLDALDSLLKEQLAFIWDETDDSTQLRPDFYREGLDAEAADDKVIRIACRSKRKIEWMKRRLESATFTSFWP